MTLTKEAVEKRFEELNNSSRFQIAKDHKWIEVYFNEPDGKIFVLYENRDIFCFNHLEDFDMFIEQFLDTTFSIFDSNRSTKLQSFPHVWKDYKHCSVLELLQDVERNDRQIYNSHELQMFLERCDKISHCEQKQENINKEIENLKQEVQNKTDKLYASWCPMIMDKIEEIAKKHYPNMPYWCDTGSRCNVVLAMLDQFDKDMK